LFVKLVFLPLVALMTACAGSDFVAEGLPNPGPDPVNVAAIDSRFVGRIAAVTTGGGQDATYDLDTVAEFRERGAGMLIGYVRMWDDLQNHKLIVNYWAQGQRTNADVTISMRFNSACSDFKLVGKLDAAGNASFPRTTQRLTCGLILSLKVVTEATVLSKQGGRVWPFWDQIEDHFAVK
jgi:hypothetical protein